MIRAILGALAFAFVLAAPAAAQGIDGNTALMLHADGTNGSTVMLDASASGHGQTAYGDAQVSTAQGKFSESLKLDGAGDWLAVSNGADLDFGSGNFTVDWWTYANSTGGCQVARNQGATYPPFILGYGGSIYMSSNGSTWDVANGRTFGPPIIGQWSHLALVRNGSQFVAFRDGQVTDAWTWSGALPAGGGPLSVGSCQAGTWFNGHIDELRVQRTAEWTSAFTPPAAPYSEVPPPPSAGYGAVLDTATANNVTHVDLVNSGPACKEMKVEVRNVTATSQPHNLLTMYASTDGGLTFDRGSMYNTTGSSIFPGESNPNYRHDCLAAGVACPAPYAFGLPQNLHIGMRLGIDTGDLQSHGLNVDAYVSSRGIEQGIAKHTTYWLHGYKGAIAANADSPRPAELGGGTWFPASDGSAPWHWAIPVTYAGNYIGAPGANVDAFRFDMSGAAGSSWANIQTGSFTLRCLD